MTKEILKYEDEKFEVRVLVMLSDDGQKELYKMVDVQCKKVDDGISIDEDGYVVR